MASPATGRLDSDVKPPSTHRTQAVTSYVRERIEGAPLALIAAFGSDDGRAWKCIDFDVMDRPCIPMFIGQMKVGMTCITKEVGRTHERRASVGRYIAETWTRHSLNRRPFATIFPGDQPSADLGIPADCWPRARMPYAITHSIPSAQDAQRFKP